MISIVMATYNGEKYLCEQIDSILNQSVQDFELIIGDDCSSDKTLDILKTYTSKDKRIKLVINKQNLGFKKNFEKLLSLTTGEYIAFSDQDDIWTKDHLEKLLNNITSYDLVCSDASLINSDGVALNLSMKNVLRIKKFYQDSYAIKTYLLHKNFVQGSTCMITRAFLNCSLPIPESFKYHDYWFALCAGFSNGIKYIDDSLLLYRQHSTNVTDNTNWTLKDKINDKLSAPNKKRQAYKKQIELIQSFEENFNLKNNDDIEYVKTAKNYLYYISIKKTTRCIKYFFKNYKYMYFDNSLLLKIIRFITFFIFKA